MNQGEGGYFGLVGLEGPVMGKDRLRIAVSTRDAGQQDNQGNAGAENMLEVRYQSRF